MGLDRFFAAGALIKELTLWRFQRDPHFGRDRWLVVLNTKQEALHNDFMSRAVVDCKQQDPKFDHSIKALVVLNTKEDAMHDDFMLRAVVDRKQQDSKFDHSFGPILARRAQYQRGCNALQEPFRINLTFNQRSVLLFNELRFVSGYFPNRMIDISFAAMLKSKSWAVPITNESEPGLAVILETGMILVEIIIRIGTRSIGGNDLSSSVSVPVSQHAFPLTWGRVLDEQAWIEWPEGGRQEYNSPMRT